MPCSRRAADHHRRSGPARRRGRAGRHARLPRLTQRVRKPGTSGTAAGGDFGRTALCRLVRAARDFANAVAVSAANGRGERLTVTQPSGAAFLSPVLLMEQTQSIAGMDVRYDSFAVPAVNRLVRAVLFNPQQAAQLHNLEGRRVLPCCSRWTTASTGRFTTIFGSCTTAARRPTSGSLAPRRRRAVSVR